MLFDDLQLIEPLLRSLKAEGYTNPTPIQEKGIPPVLEGRDLLGCAQTGTGKTAAFAIPILQILSEGGQRKNGATPIRALILTPTRELAVQIGDSFRAYGRFLNLKHTLIYGGVSQKGQTDALRRGVEIVIATPGRLLDLINQRYVRLSDVEVLVLDEADRMLDMGFINDVKRILSLMPKQKQTLFFFATMPNEIQKLANSILNDPFRVVITPEKATTDLVNQSLYFVNKENKINLLKHLFETTNMQSVLIFTRTKRRADKLAKEMDRLDIDALAIHGDKSQNARQKALDKFKAGRVRVLIATDVASRGIDVEELSHVINFEMPNVAETYVHRIGRTGRAGSTGAAISFCDREELGDLKDIQKLTGQKIPVVEEHPYATTSIRDTSRTDTVKNEQRPREGNSQKKHGQKRQQFFRRRRRPS